MSYNSVGRPKFYIDAVLLARKLGLVTRSVSDNDKYYLNPTNTTEITFASNSITKNIHIDFNSRWLCNSLTHCFILGHQLNTENIEVTVRLEEIDEDELLVNSNTVLDDTRPSNDGWSKFNFQQATEGNYLRLLTGFVGEQSQSFNLGDISIGYSYEMSHSPDLELTQTFANESLKVQTTKGGHTLTNTGWNQPPKWGVYPQWKLNPNDLAYPARRSWNLKFSYLADENSDNSGLMPQFYNELDSSNLNRGIYETSDTGSSTVKNDFLSKVMPTINLGLPFIFQPNKDVDEYAICRVNANSVVLNQEAHRVYGVSMEIVESW